tara:strand:- start:64 stop:267 length:204 start_codon:yes stop_codon:yes gene_type:complete
MKQVSPLPHPLLLQAPEYHLDIRAANPAYRNGNADSLQTQTIGIAARSQARAGDSCPALLSTTATCG